MYKIFVLFFLIKWCVCPDSYYIAKRKIVIGTWESGWNGNTPDEDRSVLGAIDPIDNERQYVCRAKNDNTLIPGKLVPMYGKCYVARGGKEHANTQYEVLINRDGYDFQWVYDRNGNFPDGSVLGGFASGWPMFICRAWIKGRQGKWRWVSGKLDPEPGFECCYVPYGGKEICAKDYQVLKNND